MNRRIRHHVPLFFNHSFFLSTNNLHIIQSHPKCDPRIYDSYSRVVRNKHTKGNSKLTPSSRAWLIRQQNDPYVHQAHKDGSPSRSMYKLQQMDTMIYDYLKGKISIDHQHRKRNTGSLPLIEKHHERRDPIPKRLFQKGHVVIELGVRTMFYNIHRNVLVCNDMEKFHVFIFF